MQVKEWLDNLNLLTMEQIDRIVDDGYDTLQKLKLLTEDVLVESGVQKKRHRLSILFSIKELELTTVEKKRKGKPKPHISKVSLQGMLYDVICASSLIFLIF